MSLVAKDREFAQGASGRVLCLLGDGGVEVLFRTDRGTKVATYPAEKLAVGATAPAPAFGSTDAAAGARRDGVTGGVAAEKKGGYKSVVGQGERAPAPKPALPSAKATSAKAAAVPAKKGPELAAEHATHYATTIGRGGSKARPELTNRGPKAGKSPEPVTTLPTKPAKLEKSRSRGSLFGLGGKKGGAPAVDFKWSAGKSASKVGPQAKSATKVGRKQSQPPR